MLSLGREHDSHVVLSASHVWVVRPKVVELLPQQVAIVLQCFRVPAMLETSLREMTGGYSVDFAATCASVMNSCLCCDHAKRTHEARLARRAFVMGVRAVPVRLHKASCMKITCSAPTCTAPQELAGRL